MKVQLTSDLPSVLAIIAERDQLRAELARVQSVLGTVKWTRDELIAERDQLRVQLENVHANLHATLKEHLAEALRWEAERDQQARFVNEWRQRAFEAKDELNKTQARVKELEAVIHAKDAWAADALAHLRVAQGMACDDCGVDEEQDAFLDDLDAVIERGEEMAP